MRIKIHKCSSNQSLPTIRVIHSVFIFIFVNTFMMEWPSKFDIALLKPDRPLKFSRWVGPVCLAIPGMFIKQRVIAGSTECDKRISVYDKDSTEICIKSPTHDCTKACPGDSGGALIAEKAGSWYQHGIAAAIYDSRNKPTRINM